MCLRRTSSAGECNKMYYLDTNAIFFRLLVVRERKLRVYLRLDLNLERNYGLEYKVKCIWPIHRNRCRCHATEGDVYLYPLGLVCLRRTLEDSECNKRYYLDTNAIISR